MAAAKEKEQRQSESIKLQIMIFKKLKKNTAESSLYLSVYLFQISPQFSP